MTRTPICFCLMLLTTAALSQDQPSKAQEKVGASRYYLGEEDALLIPVNIFGYVNKPGQYMLPSETDLISLVAFAGGFKDDAKISKVKIVRGYAVDGQPNIQRIDIKRYFQTGNPRLLPKLMPDDTIIVPGTSTVTLRKALDFAARLAVLFQIYFYVQVAKDR